MPGRADRQAVPAGPAAAVDNRDSFLQPSDDRMIFGPGDVGFDEPVLRKQAEIIKNRFEKN
jgi:hypothetical protein